MAKDVQRITRRGLIAAGAATGAAVVAADQAHAEPPPDPASMPSAGLSPTSAGRPSRTEAVLPVAPEGTTSVTFDWTSLHSYQVGASVTPAGVSLVAGSTSNNGGAVLPMPVPARSFVAKIELVANFAAPATVIAQVVCNRLGTASSDLIDGLGITSATTGLVSSQITTPIFLGVGDSLWIDTFGFGSDVQFVAATVHYFGFHQGFRPITPTRVYDSRGAGAVPADGPLLRGQTRVISVADSADGLTADVVPPNSASVVLNLTANATVGQGFLSVFAGNATFNGTSAINWDKPNATVANSVTVGMGNDREIAVFCDGTAGSRSDVIIDAVGYFT